MTIFDEKESQGDWFPFFNSHIDLATGEIIYEDPKEGAAEFCIRSMGPFWDERRKSYKKEAKFVHNPVTRQMERVVWFKDLPPEEASKESDDAWDYAIVGMRNAKWGKNGDEMECTRENKLKLIKVPAFMRYINKVFQLLSGVASEAKEAEEKNSSKPQDGS